MHAWLYVVVYTSQSNIFVNDWWLWWQWWLCMQHTYNILTTYLHTRMHCDWCWHCCHCCHSFTDILLCDDIHAVCMLITYWNHLAYTHEIIFARWFTFSFLQKVKVKSFQGRTVSILLWLFRKHKNHFHFEKYFYTLPTTILMTSRRSFTL